MAKIDIHPIAKLLDNEETAIVGITGSPSTTIEIAIDIKEESKLGRILGQMVRVVVEEEETKVLVIGQIISIETQNRWHQDPTFKGVIRLHGSLPHLSGRADNRIAVISVQAAYALQPKGQTLGHVLGTSPSTGLSVKKVTNPLMAELMKPHEKHITYMGHVYGTDVDMPFWFRHFEKGEGGAGDAHHIGVFGKSGSGKSVTAAYMLLGYAKNKDKMNILLLDPQGQFYDGRDFPDGFDLKSSIEATGMKFEKYQLLEDIFLPGDEFELFASLLQKNSFIRRAFNILSDRENDAALAIADYLLSLFRNSKGKYANLNRLNDQTSKELLLLLLRKFAEREEKGNGEGKKKKGFDYNKYLKMIYSSSARLDQLIEQIESIVSDETTLNEIFNRYWQPIVNYFTTARSGGKQKIPIDEIIAKISNPKQKGNFIILEISGEKQRLGNESVKAMFVRLIESRIKEAGEKLYSQGQKVNCLIVLDEAHRFISHESEDVQIKALTREIIDSVRTTRKYGIGYMFVTQTIESLDKEVLQQTRIFAFGYGLTLGTELKVISNLINNDSAIQLYRSFIDPSSSGRYPFMFYGSVSPLSFTGSPLFLEVYTNPSEFK